jgi:Fe-S cluster assembly protein SufD
MAAKKEFESAKNWYLDSFSDFSNNLNGQKDTFYNDLRNGAIENLKKLDFPTLKNEEWKYTNISPIMKSNFVPANNLDKVELTHEDIKGKLFGEFDYHLMVFVNGIYDESLSTIDALPKGAIVDSFSNVIKNKPEIIEKYLKDYSKTITAFDSLNAAYTVDGLIAVVPDGVIVEKPIQVLYLNGRDDEQVLSTPRNLIVAGKNAQVTIIANYEAFSENPYFSNVITEVFTDENAIIDLYKIQNESKNAFHIERVEAYQKKQSVFSHYNISFGGKIVRNDINAEMSGEYVETNYYGLYLGNDEQHVDNHTLVDHAKPNCESNELYKGILDNSARGVFNGKIMVRKDAQKTNAYQSNKTVLLSKDATIDTKPQLEIYADDVKCSHGATIGHLDDTAYFYIRSRGIPSELAKSMLIRAFANDVIDKIKIEELKEQLNHQIFEHLHRVEI